MSLLLSPISLIIISFIGIIKKKHNILYFLVYMEVILMSIAIIMSYIAQHSINLSGQLIGFYIITVAAVESALSICLIVQFFRYNGTIELNTINTIRKLETKNFWKRNI